MKNSTTFGTNPAKFLTLFTPLYWVAVLAAYFLSSRDWAIVRATATSWEHLFGLFGFCVFCSFVYVAYTDYKSLYAPSTRGIILIGVPILICLLFLAIVGELNEKSWDYENYEKTFRAVLAEDNPYRSTHSLYPPFFAEGMVFIYRAGTWLLPAMGMHLEESSLWMFVFYIHQSALLFAIILSYYLSLKLAERIGIGQLEGLLFVSGLFLFNVPLLRTILYNQINFYIVASILIAILALSHRPYLSGIAIAVGGLLKLYPFVLIVPLFALKKWRALAGLITSLVGIIAIQTNWFRDLVLWKQFILFYMSFPMERESSWFRSSSILSFLRNSLEFIGAPSSAVNAVFGIAVLLTLGWIALRFLQREQIYSHSKEQENDLPMGSETYRNVGHLVDFSVLSLLIAPSAWEHHYVIAIPLAIWAFAIHKKDSSLLLTIGLLFVFVMPVFNVYPFSYLRMAGLIILLLLTSPKKVDRNMLHNRIGWNL